MRPLRTLQLINKRFASSSVKVSPEAVKKSADAALGRVQRIAEPLMYYGKVSLEFLTKVASHQKLGPPTPAELGPAQAGIGNFISSFQTGAWRKVTIGQAGELLARGVEIAGFFYVGEMIGRGSLIGYKVPGSHAGGHH